MKRKVALIIALLTLLMTGIHAVDVVESNWIIMPQSPDTTPPTLAIHSPTNSTLYLGSVDFNFTVAKPLHWTGYKPYGGISSITYRLDGQEFSIYAAKKNPIYEEFDANSSFSIPLNALSNGTHKLELIVAGITIYFEFNDNGEPIVHDYPVNVSQTVNFTLDTKPSPTPSPISTPILSPIITPTSSPTQQPTPSSTQTPILLPVIEDPASFDFYITICVIVAAMTITLLFYAKKLRNRNRLNAHMPFPMAWCTLANLQ